MLLSRPISSILFPFFTVNLLTSFSYLTAGLYFIQVQMQHTHTLAINVSCRHTNQKARRSHGFLPNVLAGSPIITQLKWEWRIRSGKQEMGEWVVAAKHSLPSAVPTIQFGGSQLLCTILKSGRSYLIPSSTTVWQCVKCPITPHSFSSPL